MPYPGRPRVTESTMSKSVPDKPASRYRWRDPERISPQRLAELREHDRMVAGLERFHGNTNKPLNPDHGQIVARLARITAFTRLRSEGMSVTEAGRVVGVADNTARRYERTRKAAAA